MSLWMTQLKVIKYLKCISELYLESYDNKYGVSQHASGRIVIGQIRSNIFLETRENTQIGGDTLQAGILISNNASLRDTFMQVRYNYFNLCTLKLLKI